MGQSAVVDFLKEVVGSKAHCESPLSPCLLLWSYSAGADVATAMILGLDAWPRHAKHRGIHNIA